ncbi:hypothetical protein GCM10009827_020030 [Dactylosporangium maewongense]|uniref:Uncharacterized protein n=2 Tax=Dactylosporangium maewongense TaxID=634393 RepID=A0ABN1ZWZ6_9ACTN
MESAPAIIATHSDDSGEPAAVIFAATAAATASRHVAVDSRLAAVDGRVIACDGARPAASGVGAALAGAPASASIGGRPALHRPGRGTATRVGRRRRSPATRATPATGFNTARTTTPTRAAVRATLTAGFSAARATTPVRAGGRATLAASGLGDGRRTVRGVGDVGIGGRG